METQSRCLWALINAGDMVGNGRWRWKFGVEWVSCHLRQALIQIRIGHASDRRQTEMGMAAEMPLCRGRSEARIIDGSAVENIKVEVKRRYKAISWAGWRSACRAGQASYLSLRPFN